MRRHAAYPSYAAEPKENVYRTMRIETVKLRQQTQTREINSKFVYRDSKFPYRNRESSGVKNF